MAKMIIWSAEDWKKNLAKRLKYAKEYRRRWEGQWRVNEDIVLNANGMMNGSVSISPEGVLRLDTEDVTSADSAHGINYAMKFLRFVHAQMSANPPSVLARPSTSDRDDRRSADAADRICRYGRSEYDLNEVADQRNLKTLLYGTGVTKVVWDGNAGEIDEFDPESREISMTGDHLIYSPALWDMWFDPDAKRIADIWYSFEKIQMRLEQAIFLWPDKRDVLEQFSNRAEVEDVQVRYSSAWDNDKNKKDVIDIYEYYEVGKPINGMAGRHVYHLADGEMLCKPDVNPVPGAQLPYSILTDIDVPDCVYGKSFVEYIARLQDILNRLDSQILENVIAHGVIRFILPDGAEVEDQSISNSSWDWIKVTGGNGERPSYAPTPSLMPDVYKFRQQIVQGMQDLAGMTEAVQGQVNRELSGFAVQTAIDASNQIRRRLFSKYAKATENEFRLFLDNCQKHWHEARVISVVGKERAFETAEFMGADIDGGYDLIVEYGASLSLDPSRRREEIMQLQQLLKDAGVKPKTILKMIKLNDLEALYDQSELGELRQSEVFDEMVSRNVYIAPERYQDHQSMLEWAYTYVMMQEFAALTVDEKGLIYEHISAREQMATSVAATGSETGQLAGVGGATSPPATQAAQAGASPQPPAPLPVSAPPAQSGTVAGAQ